MCVYICKVLNPPFNPSRVFPIFFLVADSCLGVLEFAVRVL